MSEVQLEKLRQEMVLRIQNNGLDPGFILELSKDGLAELKRRLDKLKSKKVRKLRYPQNSSASFISWLLRNPVQQRAQRAYELRELTQGLVKGPMRVNKAKVEKEYNELISKLQWVECCIQVMMCYEDSEDRVAMLKETKARIERNLRQKKKKMAQLCQAGAGPARPV